MNGRTLLIVLLMVVVAAGAYYFGGQSKTTPAQPISVTSTPTQVIIAVSPSTTSTVTPSVTTTDENALLIAAVKAGLVAEHGPDANSLTITVSTIQGTYAKGMASASAGGGLWFAAKVNGTWKLVWDGNGTIDCTSLTAYPNFPNTLIPECYDAATQKSVSR